MWEADSDAKRAMERALTLHALHRGGNVGAMVTPRTTSVGKMGDMIGEAARPPCSGAPGFPSLVNRTPLKRVRLRKWIHVSARGIKRLG